MNDLAPRGGGRGELSAYNLDIFQIDEASRTDFEKVSEMETRRDGWTAYRDMMSEMKADLEARLPDMEEHYDSAAGKVYVKALKALVKKTEEHHELAEANRESSDSVITEVKRVRPLIEEIMKDRALAVEHQNELKSQPQDGSDAYSNALEDTQSEARRTFSESNATYAAKYAGMNPPPEYDGPLYTGRKPETPLDDNYQYAYYPDNTPYQGGPGGGVGGPGHTGDGGSGSSSQPDVTAPDSDGPVLQNPGGPTTPVNPTTPGPTIPGGGGPNGPGTYPPAFVPGGGKSTGTGPLGGRPVTAPGGTRTTPGPTNARPTPNMRPTSTPGMGRQSSPMSGRPMGANNAPKNSMLPNQRQAAAGRSPVTGSGRMPGGAGNPKPARGATPASSVRSTSVPSGGRGGVLRSAPNKGFEESLYRNTRAGRTVPGVINGAKPAGEGAPAVKSQGSPRVASAGKVFGERENKGRPGRVGPTVQAGSLTDTTANTKKDTGHTWQRHQPQPSTEPPTGSLAISRNTRQRPMTAGELAESKLQARKKWRKEFYESKQEPELEPESELFGGTEGKVTRGVIRGAGPSRPVERREAGTRFSTFGWERDD